MSSTTLFRLSGLALLIALPLQIVGFVLHPPSEEIVDVLKPMYGTSHLILLISWILALLGLPGFYARLAHRAGVLGLVGFVLTMLTAAYHVYLLLYEAFAIPVLARQPNAEALLGTEGLGHGAAEAMGALAVLPFVIILVAFPVFGIATVRARVLPPWAGWLQIASVPAFFLGMFIISPDAPGPFGTMGTTPIAWLYYLLFLGYAAGGYALWTEKEHIQTPVVLMDTPQPAS